MSTDSLFSERNTLFNQNETHWYEIWLASTKSIVFDDLFPISLRHFNFPCFLTVCF